MIPPPVDVELHEIGIDEESLVPKPIRAPEQIDGRAARDIIRRPVEVPGRTHAEFAIIALPRKHADEQAIAVVRQAVHDEVISEVHRVEMLAVTIDGVPPNSVVPEHVLELLEKMDKREATVLRMRFGLDDEEPKTLKEIGECLGLTRERVRQIEREALSKHLAASAERGSARPCERTAAEWRRWPPGNPFPARHPSGSDPATNSRWRHRPKAA